MCLMKALKIFLKIVIFIKWELISFWGVKTQFGRLPMQWIICCTSGKIKLFFELYGYEISEKTFVIFVSDRSLNWKYVTYPPTFPKSPIVVPSQISGAPSNFHPVETFGYNHANIGGAKAIQNRYNDTLKYC